MPTDVAAKSESSARGQQQDRFDAPLSAFLATVFFAPIMTAAAVLRLAFLTRKPFWFDECFSVEAARLDWSNFLHLLWWREANMSLYYVLLRGWLHFGGSAGWIRGLSVVFALAGIPAMYWLARMLFDGETGIIAAALLSVNAYHIRYAQEARSYALLFLLAVVSSGYFCAYVERPSRGNLAAYCVASVLAVYAHFYALLLIAAQALAILWRRDASRELSGKARRGLQRAWIGIGVAVLPVLIFVAKTGAGPIRWIPRPGVHVVLSFFEQLAGNEGVWLLALYVAACWAAVAPFGRKILRFAKGNDARVWRVQFLLLWFLFPVILTILLSLARPLFLPRYFIFCLPALIVLAAVGLARLGSWQLAAALGAMVLLSLAGTRSYYEHDFDLERDTAGAASDFVLNHAEVGDGVVFYIPETRAAYEFSRSQREDGRSAAPEIVYPSHGNSEHYGRMDYRDFTGKPSADFLRAAAAKYNRLWIVLMNNAQGSHVDGTTEMLSDVMSTAFHSERQWTFPKVEVRLYGR